MSALWSRANWQPQSRGSRALLGYWKHCSRTQQPPPPHCITISDNVVITFRRFRSSVSFCEYYSIFFLCCSSVFIRIFFRGHVKSAKRDTWGGLVGGGGEDTDTRSAERSVGGPVIVRGASRYSRIFVRSIRRNDVETEERNRRDINRIKNCVNWDYQLLVLLTTAM